MVDMETAKNPSIEEKSTTQRRIIKDRHEVGEILAGLIENARREIVIFAPQLDGALFNTSRFARALASFVARHRHNLARIVVEDAEQSIRDNDRLVLLFRRLSDFIHMHQVSEEHIGIREMFVVVDHRSCLYQADTSKHECISHFNDPHQAVTLARRFNELWDRSEPIQSLRSTGL
jgi:sugar-specific transcriptional regulator TrmB